MRESLFRGKCIDNGEWVEGYYYKMSETTYCFKEDYERKPVPEHHYILQERMTDWGLPNQIVQIEIEPETLCQFTGLCDKNGKKIWENDIVLVIYENRYYEKKELSTGKIVFTRGTWYIGGKVCNELYAIDEDAIFQVEIVGNIFDNPELLQEAEK